MALQASERLKALKEEMKRLQDEMTAKGRTLIREGAEEIFQRYPDLTSFGWTQYTPYFNDGDACEFGVNTYDLYITGTGINDSEEVEYDYVSTGVARRFRDEDPYYVKQYGTLDNYAQRYNYPGAWVLEAADDASELLESFTEDTLQSLFGDHVKVIVTRDNGIVVEDYDHD